MNIFYEKDLQFIWKNNFFDRENLKTTSGQRLKIIKNGILNENSGPDFINAHIKIDNIDLYGSIELHRFASDWICHKHQNDIVYKDVILHVVFKEDKEIFLKNNIKMPTLVLENIVNQNVLKNIKFLIDNSSEIFCQRMFHLKIDYLELIKERFLNKIKFIKSLLQENNNDWNETIYQFLAYNLGFKINNIEMLQLAKSIKFNIVQKICNDKTSLFSLFLGQANLFQRFYSQNSEELKRDYDFLKTKYKLQSNNIKWHFFKLHPPNFPINRIRQLVEILHNHCSLFNLILEGENSSFEEKMRKITPHFSQKSIENLVINVFIPLNAIYSGNEILFNYEKIATLLKRVQPENNKITRKFLHIIPQNAFETQALLELFNNYCTKSKCLTCPVSLKMRQG